MDRRTDLTSRRWRAQCVRVKRRDGYTCQACGTTVDLTVDHIIPPSITGIPGDQYPDSGLITLCRPCNSRKSNKVLARIDYRANEFYGD